MFKKKSVPYGSRGQVWLIPTAEIQPNPNQPRKEFPLDSLVELAQSISENGILQPLVISFCEDKPVLIAGERRLRAARIAGLNEVPCVEMTVSDKQRHALALIENLQREDMNCFEEAEGIRQLMDSYELTQCETARQLGYSQSTVANKLRLLKLSPAMRERIVRASLTERHARVLLRLNDPTQQEWLLSRMESEQLTVAQSERLAETCLAENTPRRVSRPLIRDVRVFFNTMNHALDIMRRGGIPAQTKRREENGFIEYLVRIPTDKAVKTGM